MAPAAGSSLRDRTSEFLRAVETVQARSGPAAAAKPDARGLTHRTNASGYDSRASGVSRARSQAPTKRPKSQFSIAASQVAKDIELTSAKLTRLTNLAQRRSLFDDPTAEIQELTFAIKQDIGHLNSKVEQLQSLQDSERRNQTRQAGDHTGSVLNSLQARLMDTANEFKGVLKIRSESLQAQQNRRSQFLGDSSRPEQSVPPGALGMRPPVQEQSSAGGDHVIDLGGGSLGATLNGQPMDGGRTEEFRQQMMMARPENTYLQARADAVRQVESTVAELGQIFNQLAAMVSEQGELVERIDANVDETLLNIEEGRGQLMRYYNSISSNRGLVLKIFATLFVFMIIWVLLA
mmetsp:Transcript_8378/g.18002  ORF Transcript_8378/g.18002 Transcript_8378/m.18002 type:complete len:350 (+) Transcript_8378:73-1122(+)